MDSIGEILKNERMSRGLSLQEVNDTTRITVQNLSALEEDRFDYFPNRVYARAFLRDYANFLGLDSAALVARYESGFSSSSSEDSSVEVAPVKSGGSGWKVVGYTFLGLIVLAALAAAVYFGSTYNKKHHGSAKVVTRTDKAEEAHVATLPKPSTVGKPEEEKPAVNTPAPPPAPVVDKVILSVTATEDVWVGITADGESVFGNTIPKGATKTIEASKSIKIRAGKAGAVQVKLNDKPQPSLGSLQVVGDKTYTIDDVKAQSGADTGANTPAAPAPTAGGPTR